MACNVGIFYFMHCSMSENSLCTCASRTLLCVGNVKATMSRCSPCCICKFRLCSASRTKAYDTRSFTVTSTIAFILLLTGAQELLSHTLRDMSKVGGSTHHDIRHYALKTFPYFITACAFAFRAWNMTQHDIKRAAPHN